MCDAKHNIDAIIVYEIADVVSRMCKIVSSSMLCFLVAQAHTTASLPQPITLKNAPDKPNNTLRIVELTVF